MMRRVLVLACLAVAACGQQQAAPPRAVYAPADAYDRLRVGMTTAEATRALGVEGKEITASGPLRTLSWARRGRSEVTANFVRDRLTAKRE